ncbi:MAG: Unknown protein [uncultured Sulfurovum sp.]|uniref:Uncharacterized protein n=1 Tax=uncultured Sulfurovum sp. TaxID=269237 RepID=A0A6S6T8K4_9BACT|nr:MAG: Unknown protein [uncultured Sulfurovum sp.]
MSEQSQILAEMQEIIMKILSNGAATAEEGGRIDELEVLLQQQKCYKETNHPEYEFQGEEIAGLFVNDKQSEAIEKMFTYEITPEDFFGFIEYHDEDEEFVDVFTPEFIVRVNKTYQEKC